MFRLTAPCLTSIFGSGNSKIRNPERRKCPQQTEKAKSRGPLYRCVLRARKRHSKPTKHICESLPHTSQSQKLAWSRGFSGTMDRVCEKLQVPPEIQHLMVEQLELAQPHRPSQIRQREDYHLLVAPLPGS